MFLIKINELVPWLQSI